MMERHEIIFVIFANRIKEIFKIYNKNFINKVYFNIYERHL